MNQRLDLRTVVAGASSLQERLGGGYARAPDADDERARARLDEWKLALAADDERYFEHRLRWSGLTEAEVLPLLDRVVLAPGTPLPSWARMLEAISDEAQVIAACPSVGTRQILSGVVDRDEPILMEDFYAAHLVVARRELHRRLDAENVDAGGSPLERITPSALRQLERSLIDRLAQASSQTLYEEFERFKASRLESHLEDPDVRQNDRSGSVLYDAFRARLTSEGFASLFSKYPVLGRLQSSVVEAWVEASCELLLRLQRDAGAIRAVFPNAGAEQSSPPLGPVVDVRPDLSERYDNGRAVAALTFRCGLKLIYKPKTLGAEAAFAGFLRWLNENGSPISLRPLAVVDRETYGWLEFVEPSPMDEPEAVERFYRRSGALTAVLHLLRATDCHQSNLIASGEHLHLIDAETLCQHVPRRFGPARVRDDSAARLRESIVHTLMVPFQYFDADTGEPIEDLSGLGSMHDAAPVGQGLRWEEINTDSMALKSCEQPASERGNRPSFCGEVPSPFEFLAAIRDGFADMYEYLIGVREALLQRQSPLTAFSDIRVRFLLRPAAIYFRLMELGLRPENLESGVKRSISLDLLTRAFVVAPEKPHVWPIVHDEIAAIERLDVPYYRVPSDGTALQVRSTGEVITDYFESPSCEDVRSALAQFDAEDLAYQCSILEASFQAKRTHQEREGAIAHSMT